MTAPFSVAKRLLLPLWNGGHRVAWRWGEYLGAVVHRRFEHCSVCGWFGPMLYRRWVIPPRLEECWGLSPRLAEALARKESSDCYHCGAKLRVRRLASALLDLPIASRRVKSVAQWVTLPEVRKLRVAEINRVDGLHEQLARLPVHTFSDFLEGVAPGSSRDGIRHEDLMGLTYSDASFDLVITSETLEHVPDLRRGLAEIRRVLVPGGWHVFTIPLLPTVEETFERAYLDESGAMIHRAPPICHPGGDVGYPVFTEFGLDVLDVLGQAGFEASEVFGPVSEDDLGQVFIARKPVDSVAARSQAGIL